MEVPAPCTTSSGQGTLYQPRDLRHRRERRVTRHRRKGEGQVARRRPGRARAQAAGVEAGGRQRAEAVHRRDAEIAEASQSRKKQSSFAAWLASALPGLCDLCVSAVSFQTPTGSPPARVHFQARVAAQVLDLDRGPRRACASRCSAPRSSRAPQVLVSSARSSSVDAPARRGRSQIKAPSGVEAEVPGPVRCQSAAVAALAEGFRVEEINPNTVPSEQRKRAAGAESRARGSMGPYRTAMRVRISLLGTTLPADQFVAPPTSMYSMKRTSAPTSPAVLQEVFRPRRRSTPRMTTESSLTRPRKPTGVRAASRCRPVRARAHRGASAPLKAAPVAGCRG